MIMGAKRNIYNYLENWEIIDVNFPEFCRGLYGTYTARLITAHNTTYLENWEIIDVNFPEFCRGLYGTYTARLIAAHNTTAAH